MPTCPSPSGFARQFVELHADTGAHAFHDLKDDIAVQHGLYLVVTKPRKKNGSDWSNVDIEVRDIRTGKVLWSHYFPKELPSIAFHPEDATVLLRWRLSQAGGHDELQLFPCTKGEREKGRLPL